MPIYTKTLDGFRSVISNFLKTSDGWRRVTLAYLKTSEGWRLIFSSALTPTISSPVTISKSTNSTTKLITLTGTNFPWTNAISLAYEFKREAPGTFDSVLDSGTISNPVVSNTKTLLLSDVDVIKNQTNTFTFTVTATSSASNISASSASTIVEGVRNITSLTNDSASYNSLSFSWLGGEHSNAYVYQYQTYVGGVEGTWSAQQVVLDPYATLNSLSSNTAYRIRVKGITGTVTTNPGYSGNFTEATATTAMPPIPEVISSPTISGTGYAFTSINGTSGTYVSGTYSTKSSYIGATTSNTAPTNGLTTTPLTTVGSPPYNVTQYDASAPKRYFYYVDEVTSADSSSIYYYYSSVIDAKIGQVIDSYTRTVTGGLGVMTPSINSSMSPNAYIYNVTANGSLWSVNGSAASIPSAVSGSDPFTYPQQSVSLDGATNAAVSASFPAGPDGLGLTFWSTGAGSWWASAVNRTASTTNKYVYYTLSTVCDAPGTSGDNCRSETVITQVCTAGQGTISNNCGVVTTCPQNGIGSQVTNCRTRTNNLCLDNGNGSLSTNCKSRIVATCTNNGNGSSGTNCKSRSVQTCPDNNIGSTSSNCKARVVSTCTDNGSGNSTTNCKSRAINTCPDNGSGNATTNCKSRIVTTQTCPNNGAGSTSSNCKTRTVTTYSCPSGYSLSGTLCYNNNFPYNVNNATATNTTVYDNFVSTNSTVYDATVSSTVYDAAGSTTFYDNYVNTIVYDAAGSTTVYDAQTVETIYDGNVDTYSGNVATSTTVYYKYGCTVGPVTQYGGTLPTNCSNTSSTVTVYATNLRTLNANGSTVSIANTENIFSNEESPSAVGGMTVQTSNNTISTTLYSNTGRTSTITTKSYTPSSPTKSSASGVSAFGIIKTPPGSSGGTQFDDFQIN